MSYYEMEIIVATSTVGEKKERANKHLQTPAPVAWGFRITCETQSFRITKVAQAVPTENFTYTSAQLKISGPYTQEKGSTDLRGSVFDPQW